MPQSRTKQAEVRDRQFEKWWRKNHHNSRAHDWLVKHSKRMAYGYVLNVSHYDDIHHIAKRFNKSQYKRLKYADAWCLWKVIHPLRDAKYDMINKTGERLAEISRTVNQQKYASEKTAETVKKTVVVERKRPRAIKSTARTVS